MCTEAQASATTEGINRGPDVYNFYRSTSIHFIYMFPFNHVARITKKNFLLYTYTRSPNGLRFPAQRGGLFWTEGKIRKK